MFDIHYIWTSEKALNSKRNIFRGDTNAFIAYSEGEKAWELRLYGTNSTFAFVRNTNQIYPFGHLTWTIVNDTCFGETNSNIEQDVLLNFNACKLDEFNCDDGNW